MINRLYQLVSTLPRFDYGTPPHSLPENGLYLFFEAGERVDSGGQSVDRIARVGINTIDGGFGSRIRQHYGKYGGLGGNKNGSIFRKHVGGALLRMENPNDPRLIDWLRKGGPNDRQIEEKVSITLRERFTYAYICVDRQTDREELERALIALLAQSPLGDPSPQWLGRYAARAVIRRTGLWNVQHVTAQPANDKQLDRVEELIRLTRDREWHSQ